MEQFLKNLFPEVLERIVLEYISPNLKAIRVDGDLYTLEYPTGKTIFRIREEKFAGLKSIGGIPDLKQFPYSEEKLAANLPKKCSKCKKEFKKHSCIVFDQALPMELFELQMSSAGCTRCYETHLGPGWKIKIMGHYDVMMRDEVSECAFADATIICRVLNSGRSTESLFYSIGDEIYELKFQCSPFQFCFYAKKTSIGKIVVDLFSI